MAIQNKRDIFPAPLVDKCAHVTTFWPMGCKRSMEGEGQLLGGLACASCPVYNLFLHPSAWNTDVIADTTSWPGSTKVCWQHEKAGVQVPDAMKSHTWPGITYGTEINLVQATVVWIFCY